MKTNTQSNIIGLFDESQKRDELETRARQARSILALLMTAMADDSPPCDEVIDDVLLAAHDLLEA